MATPHIESNLEDISELVLMPGDPLRAKYIAEKFLTDYKLINKVRNMYGYTGYYKGKKITVFASGMGVPSIGIYSYELYKFYNVEKIIRIGTAGSFNEDAKILDVVLSKGSYSKTYFDQLLDGNDINYIESSDELNKKILETAKERQTNIKYGNTITSDVFNPYCDDMDEFNKNYPENGNFLSVEMEAFGLFYIANKLNKQAACLMTIVDSPYEEKIVSSKERETSLDEMITLALDSIIS